MLSGKTSVFIDTTKSDDDPEQTTIPQADDKYTSEKEEPAVASAEDEKKKKLDRSKYGKFIIHFGKIYIYVVLRIIKTVTTSCCSLLDSLYLFCAFLS